MDWAQYFVVSHQSGLVVLIEDDADTEDLVLRAFRRAGQGEFFVARDGIAALDGLSNLKQAPALILLDIKLPGIDGFEVLTRIRACEVCRTAPVVLFSSDGDADSITRGIALGANEYIQKPVSYDELASQVEGIVDRYLEIAPVGA